MEAWLFSGGSEAQALRQGDGQLGLGSQDRHPTQVVIVGEELNNYISDDKNSLPFFTQNIHCKTSTLKILAAKKMTTMKPDLKNNYFELDFKKCNL